MPGIVPVPLSGIKQRTCLVIWLDHLKPTFNIGKIFRSAEAFGCREIHLVGIEFFDPDLFEKLERLTIPQYGRSDSLNVSVAASIVLYEYVRQIRVISKT